MQIIGLMEWDVCLEEYYLFIKKINEKRDCTKLNEEDIVLYYISKQEIFYYRYVNCLDLEKRERFLRKSKHCSNVLHEILEKQESLIN